MTSGCAKRNRGSSGAEKAVTRSLARRSRPSESGSWRRANFSSASIRAWDAQDARRISWLNIIPTRTSRTRSACARTSPTCASPMCCGTLRAPWWRHAAAILLGTPVPATPAGRTAGNVSPIFLRAIHASPQLAGNAPAPGAQDGAPPSRRASQPRAAVRRLNGAYFQSALPRPRLGWSRRVWRTQLGCFDPALNQIVLNRQLDHEDVPDVRSGVRPLSRNAAREAPHPIRPLPARIALRAVPQ